MLIFTKSYFVARMAELMAGILSIYLSYLIGKNIFNKKTGLINAALIAFNAFHIENSVVVMTPVVSLLAFQTFLYFLFSEKVNYKQIILLGFCFSWLILCQNGMELLLPPTIIYLYKTYKKNNLSTKECFLKIVFFLLIFTIGILPWAIKTYNYFGIPLYSNMKYYAFVDNFSDMMTSSNKPDLNLTLSTYNFSYLKKLINWLILDIFKLAGSQVAYSFLFILPLIPWIYFQVLENNKNFKINFLIISSLILLLASVVGSRALAGQMFPRHFIIFLTLTTPIISFGLLKLYFRISESINISGLFTKKIVLAYIAMLSILTITINEARHSFWEKDTKALYATGMDINKMVPKNSKIMFALTPQDAWCLTQRNIVGDPNFGFTAKPSIRAKQEVKYYNVDYLWINTSDYIYKRSDLYSNPDIYQELNLEKIYESNDHSSYLYKINQ